MNLPSINYRAVGILVVLFAVVVFCDAVQTGIYYNQLRTKGISVYAQVVEKLGYTDVLFPLPRLFRSPRVLLQWKVDGKMVRFSYPVPLKKYQEQLLFSKVELVYLKENPARFKEKQKIRTSLWGLQLGLGFFFIGIGLWAYLRFRWEQKKLVHSQIKKWYEFLRSVSYKKK